MEHSVKAYLRRLPTETLKDFLQNYRDHQQKEDFLNAINEVLHELASRKEETADP